MCGSSHVTWTYQCKDHWPTHFTVQWAHRTACNLLTGKENHFMESQVSMSQWHLNHHHIQAVCPEPLPTKKLQEKERVLQFVVYMLVFAKRVSRVIYTPEFIYCTYESAVHRGVLTVEIPHYILIGSAIQHYLCCTAESCSFLLAIRSIKICFKFKLNIITLSMCCPVYISFVKSSSYFLFTFFVLLFILFISVPFLLPF